MSIGAGLWNSGLAKCNSLNCGIHSFLIYLEGKNEANLETSIAFMLKMKFEFLDFVMKLHCELEFPTIIPPSSVICVW